MPEMLLFANEFVRQDDCCLSRWSNWTIDGYECVRYLPDLCIERGASVIVHVVRVIEL